MKNIDVFLDKTRDFAPGASSFNEGAVIACVDRFYAERRKRKPRYEIVPDLFDAVVALSRREYDTSLGLNDLKQGRKVAKLYYPELPNIEQQQHWRAVYQRLFDVTSARVIDDATDKLGWGIDKALKQHYTYAPPKKHLGNLLSHYPTWSNKRHFFQLILQAALFAPMSDSILEAMFNGLGWLVPTEDTVLLVPQPKYILQTIEQDLLILHNDGGQAIEWENGHGYFYLEGAHFSPTEYLRLIDKKMSAEEALSMTDLDKRSVAITALGPSQLIDELGAELMNVGTKGTRLYRLKDIPFKNRHIIDRTNFARWNYFIYMRDASHPEREFIEWVDPAVGVQGNAELCQAVAFGITLEEWLSIEQEG